MESGFKELSDLPLENLNDQGQVPKSRIKDVKSATELYRTLKKGDEGSAVNRARVQAMFDGDDFVQHNSTSLGLFSAGTKSNGDPF